MKKKTNLSIIYFIVILGAWFLIIQSLGLDSQIVQLTYSEFKALIRTRSVSDVRIGSSLIQGKLNKANLGSVLPQSKLQEVFKQGQEEAYFQTVRVEDPGLVKELEQAGIPFSGVVENTWLRGLVSWLIPGLIFLAIWAVIIRKAGTGSNLMAIGKSKAKVYIESDTKTTFADVAGIDEAKDELVEVVEFLRSPEKFRRLGGNIPKGVLLVGPPGTGKTLLARAVAGEAKVPFFSMSGSEFVEMFVGVGAARVRDLFRQAQEKAPCIVFIDELDALGKARGVNPLGSHEEREQTLNQLLVEMDGFEPNTRVMIMAATNRPETLDPALLRAGRFDRHVVVDRPDVRGRRAILEVHARKVKLAPEVDLGVIAARTPGFVGADLANIVNEAALLAARRGRTAVTADDLDEAIDRVIAGLEKKNRVINKKEKEIVAIHESGHAVVATSLPNVDPVHKVSIIPRGVAALGYTQQLPTEERFLMTRSELDDRLCVLLGGRVAEEIVFGDISTGAQDDLQKATDIARSMVVQYGMSDKLGLRTFERERRSLFLQGLSGSERDYSEQKASEIDGEIELVLSKAHERVREILTEKKSSMEDLARLLLEQEVIEGDQLRRLLNDGATSPGKVEPTSDAASVALSTSEPIKSGRLG